MNTRRSKLVVVLGMHRSGTSVVTRGLQVLGVQLGDNLMPEVRGDNEKGFWEDLEICEFNEALLKKLGATWDGIEAINEADLCSKDFESERIAAINLLKQKINNSDVFGFKDPRTSVLLPFWQSVFRDIDIDVRYVLVIRNPLSVADSLYKRDGFEKEKALLLWEKYQIAAVKFTSDKKRILIEFDDYFKSSEIYLNKLSRFLEVDSIENNQAAFDYYVDDFLSGDLRHHKFNFSDLDKVVTPLTKEIYQVLLDMRGDNFSSSEVFRDKWLDIEKRHLLFAWLYPYMDKVERKYQQLKYEYQQLQRDKDTAEFLAETMLNSRSWKMTKPLRTIKQFVSGLKVFRNLPDNIDER